MNRGHKDNAKSVWLQLETALHIRKNKEGLNIWRIADEHHNLLKYRPLKNESVELAEVEGKDSARSYILRNPDNDRYIILGGKDLYLWNLMDSKRSVKDLYIELTMEYGLVTQTKVFSLIQLLKNNGFLHTKPTSVFQSINEKIRQHKFLYQIKGVIDYLLHARLTTKKADVFFTDLYSRLSFAFRRFTFFLMLGMLAVNIGLTSYFVFVKHESMLLTPHTGAGSHDVIAMMVITYLSVLVHEIAHGLAVKHYGRKVLRAGLKLLYGSPIAYVDTSDILMKGRIPRIGVSFAGPFINGIIGCVLLLLALWFPESIYENITLHAGLINSLLFVVNLIPFAETDGHFIIQDWLVQPQLRKESLEFIRRGMWNKFVGREKWHKKDLGYLLYGSISLLGICYLVAKGVHLWSSTGRHLLEKTITHPRMAIEILLFWVASVLLIAFFRTVARGKGEKTNIVHLLKTRLND